MLLQINLHVNLNHGIVNGQKLQQQQLVLNIHVVLMHQQVDHVHQF